MIEPQYAQTDVHGEPLSEEEKTWLDNHSIDIDPFVKTNWKSGEDRDEWKQYTDEFQRARQLAEWRSVLDDETPRQAAIIHVRHTNRDTWLERVGEHGLEYRQIRYSKPYNGYSHKTRIASENNPERISYAVIAENEDIADKMYEAETELGGVERHHTVGSLLGFPECCREFFNENFLQQDIRDPMYEIACNTPSATAIDGDPQNLRIEEPRRECNPLYRYFGHAFLTHMPCSFECDEAADIAMRRGEIMAEHGYREVANKLYQWLGKPMVWEGHKAIAQVRNNHFIGASNTSDYWSEKRIVWGEEHNTGESVVQNH